MISLNAWIMESAELSVKLVVGGKEKTHQTTRCWKVAVKEVMTGQELKSGD